MAHTTLIVNGATVLDQPLDEWQQRPPEQIMAMLNPHAANRQPWTMPTLGILTEAALQNRGITIRVADTTAGFVIDASYH